MSILKANISLKKHGFSLELDCTIKSPITGIFGPSGAGKTTFLRLINGLETPDRGVINIQNREVFNSESNVNLAPEKRRIGYVFQDGKLFPHMTVEKNLKYGIKGKHNKSMFDDIIRLLKISEQLKKKPNQISGGQAQRVAIGRALLSSPDLLVLDEPFSSLDKNLRHRIIFLLKPLIYKFKIPMLIVSHELSDLLLLSDQLLILKNGRSTGYGSYLELISKDDAFAEMNRSGLVNSIELKFDHFDSSKGLMILSHGETKICTETYSTSERIVENDTINVILRPEDITLALHRIEDISIQNQIKGTIQKIIKSENKVLCVIDHGFKIIAEVTLATQQKMKLREGLTIWSLFKAAAIKTTFADALNSY